MADVVNFQSFEHTPPPSHTIDMKTIPAPSWPDLHGAFRFLSHGRVHINRRTMCFGFQIHVSSAHGQPSLLFALMQEKRGDNRLPVKFGIRLDLANGEINDIANQTGIIGQLDPDVCQYRDGEYPILLRWEVEHTGQVLIPRLHVGTEEWLYPSLLFPGDGPFMAITGHDAEDRRHEDDIFSTGYVWCQDRLK